MWIGCELNMNWTWTECELDVHWIWIGFVLSRVAYSPGRGSFPRVARVHDQVMFPLVSMVTPQCTPSLTHWVDMQSIT